MDTKRILVSYAQYHEDLTLYSILHDIEEGFYIDVGANFATTDSVTKLFYDRSWRGINIEPIKKHYDELKRLRKRDINLDIALGSKKEKKTFYEDSKTSGHSSFVETNTNDLDRVSYVVEVDTLENVCKKYCPDQTISFLKVDVEGFEEDVIKGADFNAFRPIVICIETSHIAKNWRNLITDKAYTLIISDGLNEYYLANEELHRLEGLEERLVINSYNALKEHQYRSVTSLNKQYKLVLSTARHYEKIITNQASQLIDYNSYKSQSLYKATLKDVIKILVKKALKKA